MINWLKQTLVSSAESMPESAFGHCLGRGLPERILVDCGIGVWTRPESSCPDTDFTRRFGAHGEAITDWLSVPLWAPSGKLLGVEFRRWQGDKAVMKHFLPPSKWTPTFIGLSGQALNEIWSGADVWLVEGVFDLALAHVAQGVVLACGGARLSQSHVNFVSRFMQPSATVFLAFDEDPTGRNMAEGRYDDTGRFHEGARQALERVNARVQVVHYRGGKDPGEIWDHGGRAGLQAAFSNYIRRS